MNKLNFPSTSIAEYDPGMQTAEEREATKRLDTLIRENSIHCVQQHDGDLGEKMWHTFETSSKCFEKTIIASGAFSKVLTDQRNLRLLMLFWCQQRTVDTY